MNIFDEILEILKKNKNICIQKVNKREEYGFFDYQIKIKNSNYTLGLYYPNSAETIDNNVSKLRVHYHTKEKNKIVDYICLSLFFIYNTNKLFELYCVKVKEQLKNKYKGDYYVRLLFCLDLLIYILKVYSILDNDSNIQIFLYDNNDKYIIKKDYVQCNSHILYRGLLSKIFDIINYFETFIYEKNHVQKYQILYISEIITCLIDNQNILNISINGTNILAYILVNVFSIKEHYSDQKKIIEERNHLIEKIKQPYSLKKILSLHDLVDDFLSEIDVKNYVENNNISKEEYILNHYSNKNTLQSLLNLDDDKIHHYHQVTLRAYNTEYMNDPNEGRILINNLDKEWTNKFEFSKDIYITSFIYELKNNDKNIPMWQNYGDQCKGISLGFDIDQENDNIYFVLYLDKESNILNLNLEEEFKKKMKNKLMKVMESLKEIELMKDDNNFLLTFYIYELNKLRFLIKSSEFNYENECRIIKNNPRRDLIKHDKQNPKLFVEYNLTLKQICFGNQFEDRRIWELYTEKSFPNIEILTSNLLFKQT